MCIIIMAYCMTAYHICVFDVPYSAFWVRIKINSKIFSILIFFQKPLFVHTVVKADNKLRFHIICPVFVYRNFYWILNVFVNQYCCYNLLLFDVLMRINALLYVLMTYYLKLIFNAYHINNQWQIIAQRNAFSAYLWGAETIQYNYIKRLFYAIYSTWHLVPFWRPTLLQKSTCFHLKNVI